MAVNSLCSKLQSQSQRCYTDFSFPFPLRAEIQTKLQPALPRLSAMISQSFAFPLLPIQHRLLRGFVQLKLGAHFLYPRSKRCNFLLQLFNGAVFFGKGFMLF